jgi:hypothetical protein
MNRVDELIDKKLNILFIQLGKWLNKKLRRVNPILVQSIIFLIIFFLFIFFILQIFIV